MRTLVPLLLLLPTLLPDLALADEPPPVPRTQPASRPAAASRGPRTGLTIEANLGVGRVYDELSPVADVALGVWLSRRLALSLRIGASRRDAYVDNGSSGRGDRAIVHGFVGPSLQYWLSGHVWVSAAAGLATHDIVGTCIDEAQDCEIGGAPGVDLRAGYAFATGSGAVNVTVALVPNGLLQRKMGLGGVVMVGYQSRAAPPAPTAAARDLSVADPRPLRSRRPVLLAVGIDGVGAPAGGGGFLVPSVRLSVDVGRRARLAAGVGYLPHYIYTAMAYGGVQVVVANRRSPGFSGYQETAAVLFARAGFAQNDLGDAGEYESKFAVGGAGVEYTTASGFTAFAEVSLGTFFATSGSREGPGSFAVGGTFGVGYRFGRSAR